MATTKKTVKTDATDKKSNATKKTATTQKKTVKKEVESTGVVDEFLNENMGKVVTETPKPEKKKATAKKKTEVEVKESEPVKDEFKKKAATKKKNPTSKAKKVEEEKIKDAEAQINEVMKEMVTPAEESEGIVTNYADTEVSDDYYGNVEPIKPEESEKTPEEKWNDLGLTNEMQEEIKEVVKEIDNKEVDKLKNPIAVKTITEPLQDRYASHRPKRTYYEVINVEYPPKPDEEEIKEEVKNSEKNNKTIEDTNKEINNLRVNLEEKKPANKFTLVNWSMGVSYD